MALKKKELKQAKLHSYTVLFEPMAEGGYNIVFPAIPEICTFGGTLMEAKRMATDALFCFLESSEKDQKALPRDIRRSPRIERISVKLATV